CKKVNAAYQPVLDGTAPAGCVTVRYEELVADPAGGLRRLAEQTGLPFDPAKIAELKWLEDEYRHQETWRTPLEGGPASTESVGTYRQELTALERAQTELACNTIIRKFGYQPDSTPRNWSTLARLREAMFGRTH